MTVTATWCGCPGENTPVPLMLRGRSIVVESDRGTCAEEILGACVRCGHAVLPNQLTGTLHDDERMPLHELALPVSYARGIIGSGKRAHALSLPTVEQISAICGPQRISTKALEQPQQISDAEIIRRMRDLFSVPEGDHVLSVPGMTKTMVVNDRFFRHMIVQDRRWNDPGHRNYLRLVPQTVRRPVEVWRSRYRGALSYVFLAIYNDLDDQHPRRHYVYHVAYTVARELSTAFRFSQGADEFRSNRDGELVYAAYTDESFAGA